MLAGSGSDKTKFEEFVNTFIYTLGGLLLFLSICLLWFGIVRLCEKFAQIKRVRPEMSKRRKRDSIENLATEGLGLEPEATDRHLIADTGSNRRRAE